MTALKLTKKFVQGHQANIDAFKSISAYLLSVGVSISFSPEPGQYRFLGMLKHFDGENPEILLYRPRPDEAISSMERELITLAHEAGHWISFLDHGLISRRSEALATVSRCREDNEDISSLPDSIREEFVLEERDAWYFAEQLLRQHRPGSDARFWQYFDTFRNQSMKDFRTTAGV